eukprot:Tamp_12725.p1 GENE.Tamp_12725~~Tamp_12725.p1  ORF type:complete len:444 (+),score=49.83 Tamp_12725:449-1780(+)
MAAVKGSLVSLRRTAPALVLCVYVVAQAGAQAPSPSQRWQHTDSGVSAAEASARPDKLQVIGGSEVVVLCQTEDGTVGCQTVDPCGPCGRGRCSNLDEPCLGAGVLKSGFFCNLRFASVPAGVEVVFYNLWGPWSFNSNDCAAFWWCYSWPFWPFGCLRGSEPRERWAGPIASSLDDARCAVWIDIQPGFTCAACPDGFFRSNTTGPAECLPCSVDECPPGRYRGECGYSSDSKCLECPAGTYKTSAGNDINRCTKCPGSTFSRITGSASPASCTLCAAVTACGNLSFSEEGSSSPDDCECPFARAHPLAVSLAITSACAAVALLVLQQNARARRAGDESLLAHDTLASAPAETLGSAGESCPADASSGCPAMGGDGGERVCVVCHDREATHAFDVCGHRCVCDSCASFYQHHLLPNTNTGQAQQACPMCRRHFVRLIRIFDP